MKAAQERRALQLGLTAVCLLVLFLSLAVWIHTVPRGITFLDRAIAQDLHALSSPLLDNLARFLALAGSLGTLLGVAAVVGMTEEHCQAGAGKAAAVTVALCALCGDGIVNLLKLSFHRPRPTLFPHLFPATDYSFPSGHAFLGLAVYGLVATYAIRRAATFRRAFFSAVLWLLWIVLIGLSRVYSGVHYMTDVLAGWTAGSLWLLVCLRLSQLVRQRAIFI